MIGYLSAREEGTGLQEQNNHQDKADDHSSYTHNEPPNTNNGGNITDGPDLGYGIIAVFASALGDGEGAVSQWSTSPALRAVIFRSPGT